MMNTEVPSISLPVSAPHKMEKKKKVRPARGSRTRQHAGRLGKRERQLRGAYLPHTLGTHQVKAADELDDNHQTPPISHSANNGPLQRTVLPSNVHRDEDGDSWTSADESHFRNGEEWSLCDSSTGDVSSRQTGDKLDHLGRTLSVDSHGTQLSQQPGTMDISSACALYAEYSYRPMQYQQINDREYRRRLLANASNAVREAECIWDVLISQLRARGAEISYHDLVNVSNMKTIPDHMLPVLGYVCILLGLNPAAKMMKRTLFKELIPLHMFLREVEPLSLPLRRLRKAYCLRQLITDAEIDTMSGEYVGIRNILRWADAFQAVASLVLSVDEHRKVMRQKASTLNTEWFDLSMHPSQAGAKGVIFGPMISRGDMITFFEDLSVHTSDPRQIENFPEWMRAKELAIVIQKEQEAKEAKEANEANGMRYESYEEDASMEIVTPMSRLSEHKPSSAPPSSKAARRKGDLHAPEGDRPKTSETVMTSPYSTRERGSHFSNIDDDDDKNGGAASYVETHDNGADVLILDSSPMGVDEGLGSASGLGPMGVDEGQTSCSTKDSWDQGDPSHGRDTYPGSNRNSLKLATNKVGEYPKLPPTNSARLSQLENLFDQVVEECERGEKSGEYLSSFLTLIGEILESNVDFDVENAIVSLVDVIWRYHWVNDTLVMQFSTDEGILERISAFLESPHEHLFAKAVTVIMHVIQSSGANRDVVLRKNVLQKVRRGAYMHTSLEASRVVSNLLVALISGQDPPIRDIYEVLKDFLQLLASYILPDGDTDAECETVYNAASVVNAMCNGEEDRIEAFHISGIASSAVLLFKHSSGIYDEVLSLMKQYSNPIHTDENHDQGSPPKGDGKNFMSPSPLSSPSSSSRSKPRNSLQSYVKPVNASPHLDAYTTKDFRVLALKIVGNLLSGNEVQTQRMLDMRILKSLVYNVESDFPEISSIACWALSNITAGAQAHIQNVIDANGIDPVVKQMFSDSPGLRVEATWALANALSRGSLDQVFAIAQPAFIEDWLTFLKTETKSKALYIALCGLNSLLEKVTYMLDMSDMESTPELIFSSENSMMVVATLLDCECEDIVKSCYGHKRKQISAKVDDILEKYFPLPLPKISSDTTDDGYVEYMDFDDIDEVNLREVCQACLYAIVDHAIAAVAFENVRTGVGVLPCLDTEVPSSVREEYQAVFIEDDASIEASNVLNEIVAKVETDLLMDKFLPRLSSQISSLSDSNDKDDREFLSTNQSCRSLMGSISDRTAFTDQAYVRSGASTAGQYEHRESRCSTIDTIDTLDSRNIESRQTMSSEVESRKFPGQHTGDVDSTDSVSNSLSKPDSAREHSEDCPRGEQTVESISPLAAEFDAIWNADGTANAGGDEDDDDDDGACGVQILPEHDPFPSESVSDDRAHQNGNDNVDEMEPVPVDALKSSEENSKSTSFREDDDDDDDDDDDNDSDGDLAYSSDITSGVGELVADIIGDSFANVKSFMSRVSGVESVSLGELDTDHREKTMSLPVDNISNSGFTEVMPSVVATTDDADIPLEIMEADKTFKFDITMPVIANDVFEGSFDAAFDQAFANFDAAFNKAFFPEGMPRMSELDTQRKELLVPPSDPTPDQLSDVQINDSARPAKPSTAGMIPKDPSMQIEVFEVSFDDAFDKAFEHFDDSFTKAFFPMQSVPEIDAIDNDSDLKVEGDDCGTTDDDRVGNENSPQEIVPDDQRTETGRKSIMDDIEVLISDNVRLENDDARRVDTEPSMHGDGDAPTAIQPVDAIHQLSSELNDILTLVGTEDLSPDANVPPFDDLTSQLDMNTYVDVLSNDSVSKMSGKYTNLPSSAIADDGGGTGGHGGEMIVSQAVIAEAEPVIADAASFIAFVKSSFMPDEGSVSKVTDGDARAEDGGINIDESYILGSSQKPLHSPIRASELPLEHHIENNPFRQFKFVVHHDDD